MIVPVILNLCLWTAPVQSGTTAHPLTLLISGPKETFRLTLDGEIDGQPLAATWNTALGRLFADLDRNSDGVLDPEEAKRAPDALRLRQLGWSYFFAVPRAAVWDELDRNHDGRVTRDEFTDNFQRNGLRPLSAGVGQFAPTAKLNRAILNRIGSDGASALTQEAWSRADKILASLDSDQDEMIRPDEILPRTPYPGSFGGLALSASRAGKDQPQLLRDLPVRLETDDERRMTVPFEIARQIRLDKKAISILAGNAAATDPAFSVHDGVRLVFYPVPGKAPEEWSKTLAVAQQRFVQADLSKDGFADRAECAKIDYAPLRDHFAFADRDGDGKLSRAEWDKYLDLRSALISRMFQITILDSGPSLFEALDTDADGALSVRELRNAWKSLQEQGCIKGGKLDVGSLPRRIRFIVSQGTPRELLRRVPREGPAWFLAMDRNKDGDVSRREFLGDEATFKRLDTDGDGLISRAEAEKAKP